MVLLKKMESLPKQKDKFEEVKSFERYLVLIRSSGVRKILQIKIEDWSFRNMIDNKKIYKFIDCKRACLAFSYLDSLQKFGNLIN